ncbi:g4140 [Coccomyxa viridis]|uniref:Uridine kinase n=1 Tax=Coccomyxa viridis TaxID=1274662 RepID=A0ABP1FWN4_9CHLO
MAEEDGSASTSSALNGLRIECPNGDLRSSWSLETPRGSKSSRSRSTRGRSQPFVIGVAGGTASGKTTVCNDIMQRLHDQCVVMLSQDSFYRGLSPEELADVASYNFDHPNSIDNEAVVQCLTDLQNMKSVEVPIYDFATHQRSPEVRHVEPADVVIIEGILVLHIESIRELLNMKIFVDTDDDLRLARRIQRDVAMRGRDIAGVIEQYTKFVKPAFDTFVAPSRKHADVIIPWGRQENEVAIDLITEHIRMKLQQPELRRIYHNLELMPSNFQIRGMHTLIRDRSTSKADFVFYADRLLRLVVEHSLGHLPFQEKCVVTATGHPYTGVDFAKKLCGVSIIRSGESMENALRACCKGIKIGKILVHRVGDHVMDKELIYEKLPADIAERHVLLMDPILATGNSAVRAIQVVLSKGVDEGKILFLSLIAAPEGIHMVCKKFPRVKVITSEIDEGIDESTFQVIPGVGEFGDRYFCD